MHRHTRFITDDNSLVALYFDELPITPLVGDNLTLNGQSYVVTGRTLDFVQEKFAGLTLHVNQTLRRDV